MNPSTVSDFVNFGEGFSTEFKCSGTSRLGREKCAFAHATEEMILGSAHDGEGCGVGVHNRLNLGDQSIAHWADPPVGVDIDSVGQPRCVHRYDRSR